MLLYVKVATLTVSQGLCSAHGLSRTLWCISCQFDDRDHHQYSTNVVSLLGLGPGNPEC